jgi:hypothetical protein
VLRIIMIFAATIATIASGAEANAQKSTLTGKVLFDLCTSDQRSSTEFLSCILFIRGFLSGVNTATSGTGRIPKNNSGLSLCLPDGLSAGEAAAAFVQTWRSLKRTGDVTPLMNEGADVVLPFLLMQAYPCK